MKSKPEGLRERTKSFAIRIVKLSEALPRTAAGKTIAGQIVRCGSSVAANYRAVCRARSRAEFISKMSIVVEEVDETLFWLELIVECDFVKKQRLAALIDEANQLTAIFAASRKTSRGGY